MAVDLDIQIDQQALNALRERNLKRAIYRSVKRGTSTALRDMKSEANKRIRRRKRIKLKLIRRAMVLQRAKGTRLEDLEFGVRMKGEPVPLSAYPHRQIKMGVSASVNPGKRSRVGSAFVATMPSGHRGVFLREPGAARLPIRELLASRPVDALLHDGEAEGVRERGRRSLVSTINRTLRLELDKAKGMQA